MTTSKYLEEADYQALLYSLANDEFHKDTPLEFFLEPGTICSLYSDDKGPVVYVRGKSIVNESGIRFIQLDLQFISNGDAKRNIKVMLDGFKDLEEKAKCNNFHGFFFESDVVLLRQFCIKRLGFLVAFGDMLYKVFDKPAEVEYNEII
jgi:hypothetical protein